MLAEPEQRRKQAVLDLLEDFREIAASLTAQLQNADSNTLKTWLKLAAKSNRIEYFMFRARMADTVQ